MPRAKTRRVERVGGGRGRVRGNVLLKHEGTDKRVLRVGFRGKWGHGGVHGGGELVVRQGAAFWREEFEFELRGRFT